MKHSQTRRDECTHAISAKLTAEAFEIYKEWRHRRRGSREISNAILAHSRAKANLAREKAANEVELTQRRSETIQQRNEIYRMQQNIAALQDHLKRFIAERDELGAIVSESYCPKRPE